MADIVLKNLRKSFGRMETIHGIDLSISDGEFVVFVGPSGCGKSTLLRLIAGLEDVTDGDLLIGGARVNDRTPKERGIAMVFQSYALYPHMTVYQNMAFGLELAKLSRAAADAKVREAARILELEPLLERLPRQLSGGQRQRVAIGRAIVREPKVFLFDEPLSNLDAALRVQMRIEIAKLHRALRTTMVYVTHDQVEAMTLANKIVVLNAGRIEQVGAPLELYHRPCNLFVAGFIGSPQMNFLPVTVEASGDGRLQFTLPFGGTLSLAMEPVPVGAGEKLMLGIRPEHLLESGGEGGFEGEVEVVEDLGESHFLHVRMADGQLITARAAGAAPLPVGSKARLGVLAKHVHLFRDTGEAVRPAR